MGGIPKCIRAEIRAILSYSLHREVNIYGVINNTA
jgi:hypothetical protein